MNFLQNMDSQLIIWAAIGALVIFGIIVVNNKMRRVAAFGARAALGVALISAANFVLGGFGVSLAVGINVLTMAVAAFLGIPGIVMLYGLTLIL
jgi:inhibitor of the pro-sigma K processing machinery